MGAEVHGEKGHPADGIKQRPQRQDSLRDQLADLHGVASRLGMYDAADWLWKHALHSDQADLFGSKAQAGG